MVSKCFEMGKRNFVVEGVSGTGKTSVCDELTRRGYHALHGDRVLRPQKIQASGHAALEAKSRDEAELAALVHHSATWDRAKVLRHIENHEATISFFCGGFRNHSELLDLFDGAFVLEVDADTLVRRLAKRPVDEFGGRRVERALILKLHATGQDLPKDAIPIDATQPVEMVADQIIKLSNKALGV